jgi:hypothetical protein
MVLISNQPTLKDVRIDHVTAVNPRVFLNVGIKQAHIQNFVFTNNLIGPNERTLTSTGGGAENCVSQPDKLGLAGILNTCFDASTFSHNVIVNGVGSLPSQNFNPKDLQSVGLAKHEGGLKSFRLCRAKGDSCKSASQYLGAGNDRKDIGADVDAVTSAIQGVAE